jgi:cytochrome c556
LDRDGARFGLNNRKEAIHGSLRLPPSHSKKCVSARTTVTQYVRTSLGLKAPRGWGWITNPKKATYNRIYYRTTRGCLVLVVAGIAAVGFLVATIAADTTERRRASPRRQAVAERQRAAAPTGWDKMVREVFLEDAFSILGDRTRKVIGQLLTPPIPQKPNEFDRAVLMKSLKKTEEIIAQVVATDKTFKQNAALLDEQIKMITGIALELKDADPDYKDDDDYQRFVQSMRDSAVSIRAAVSNTSYEASRVSFGKLKQSCDSCHRAFR